MPLFDYRCPECGATKEHLLDSWRDTGPGACSSKGCPGVPERQVGTFSARFHGAGFHQNDYPKADRLRAMEREGVVAYTPQEQHNLKRQGKW